MPMIGNPLGGRKVKEWIGKTPDTPAPNWVRDRVFQRHNGRCHISGTRIMPGMDWEAEHIKPLGLGGENRESNLAPALVDPHKIKTKEDRSLMDKADRMRRKHQGTWPQSKAKIHGRGFAKTRDF